MKINTNTILNSIIEKLKNMSVKIYPSASNFVYLDDVISVLKEELILYDETISDSNKYRSIINELEQEYGECDGLLEKVVDCLVKHDSVEFSNPVYKSMLLTDEEVDMWNEYRKIGTVEECRKAVERIKELI